MFMTSAVVLTATDRQRNNRIRTISAGRLDAADSEQLRSHLVRFLVGGLSAAATMPSKPSAANRRL